MKTQLSKEDKVFLKETGNPIKLLIKLYFPQIKGLEVIFKNKEPFISFDEGSVDASQVLKFLEDMESDLKSFAVTKNS